MSNDDFRYAALGRYTEAVKKTKQSATARAGHARDIVNKLRVLTGDTQEATTQAVDLDSLRASVDALAAADQEMHRWKALANAHAGDAGESKIN